MRFKKICFLPLTICLIFSMITIGGNKTTEEVSAKEKNIQSLAVTTTNLKHVILVKNESQIQIPFLDYALLAGNNQALNGYTLRYVVAGDEKIYRLMDYALYFSVGNTTSDVLTKLANANLEKTVEGVTQGKFVGGKLEDANSSESNMGEIEGDLEIESIE